MTSKKSVRDRETVFSSLKFEGARELQEPAHPQGVGQRAHTLSELSDKVTFFLKYFEISHQKILHKNNNFFVVYIINTDMLKI